MDEHLEKNTHAWLDFHKKAGFFSFTKSKKAALNWLVRLLVSIFICIFILILIDNTFHISKIIKGMSGQIWEYFGINPDKNIFFVRFNSLWTFIQAMATFIALFSFILLLREHHERNVMERIRLKSDMDPLVIPEPIQHFYLKDKKYQANFILLDIVNAEEVVEEEEEDKYKYYSEKKKVKIMRTSWSETVFDILPADEPKIKYHALFYIINLRKGIADNIEISMCNGIALDDNSRWEYHFGEKKEHVIREGKFYDLIEDTPIIIFKEEKQYGRRIEFNKNFAVQIKYISNYTKETVTQVYEAVVECEKYYIKNVRLSRYYEKNLNRETKNRPYKYDKYIRVKENTFETIAYIKMFNKITDKTNGDGIYYSN